MPDNNGKPQTVVCNCQESIRADVAIARSLGAINQNLVFLIQFLMQQNQPQGPAAKTTPGGLLIP